MPIVGPFSSRTLGQSHLSYFALSGAISFQDLSNAKNSYNVTPEELFDLFGKFGPVRYVKSWADMLIMWY